MKDSSIITLLTDFGLRDYYVGALKGTLARLAPGARTIDISHDVAPGDIEEGAFLIGATHRHFPAGTVHLAVVDPGVGGQRKILAARTDGGFLVAPDNGLLTYFLDEAEVRNVERPNIFLDAPGETFHGRDRMAPVAAYLTNGEPWEELGPVATSPLRLDRPGPTRSEDGLEGRIVHIDRFGNLVSNLPTAWLPVVPATRFLARVGTLEITRWATHFAEIPAGEAALIPGSLGTLEVSMDRENVAELAGIERGERLRIDFR